MQYGLTSAEVKERMDTGRSNKDAKPSSRSYGQIIRENTLTFFNALNLTLAAAVAVFAIRDASLWVNIAFIGVVFWNSTLGILQEIRAKIVVDRLNILTRQEVTVIRDGQEQSIPTSELVENDCFIVARGDEVPVDAVILETAGLELDESLLTGESHAVVKRAGKRLLSGSTVLAGEGLAEARAVGLDTFAKKLAAEAKKEKKMESMLVTELNRLVRGVARIIVPLGVLLLLKGLLVDLNLTPAEVVVTTVSNLVSMIPEGLILLTSVALAVSVLKLAARQTMAQTLTGIESLARVDVLCLDKTGTITTGEVEMLTIETLGATNDAVDAALVNLCDIFVGEGINATQLALNAYAANKRTDSLWAVRQVVPFSSERKWSGASFEGQGSYVIGAPSMLLSQSAAAELEERILFYAKNGHRVLLLAHLDASFREPADDAGYHLPGVVNPLALVVLSDKIRADAARTFDYFKDQQVQLKIISGDHPQTTAALAERAGVEQIGEAVDCFALPEEVDFAVLAKSHNIFGRVSPYQKRQLIQALQERGHQVAMVGDGVNDVLALKAANCSIAMASGSDAARTVSDMVLLDNNLASMVAAVYEGRRVINNVQRVAILFLVKTMYASLMALFMLLFPLVYPLFPIQGTLISTLTVGIPSFFLALKPNRERVQGSFLGNVIPVVAAPGLTIVLTWVAIQICAASFGWSYEQLSTLSMLIVGSIGLVTLVRVGFPYDPGRVVIVLFSVVTFWGAVLLFPGFFNIRPFSVDLLVRFLPFLAGALGLHYGLVRLIQRWIKNGYWRRSVDKIKSLFSLHRQPKG